MMVAELHIPFPGPYGIFGNNRFIVFRVDYNVPSFSEREKKILSSLLSCSGAAQQSFHHLLNCSAWLTACVYVVNLCVCMCVCACMHICVLLGVHVGMCVHACV